ncbi:hypothetical protein EBU94_08975 [bacterium]|nr:hypothetical protein [bacterium]
MAPIKYRAKTNDGFEENFDKQVLLDKGFKEKDIKTVTMQEVDVIIYHWQDETGVHESTNEQDAINSGLFYQIRTEKQFIDNVN